MTERTVWRLAQSASEACPQRQMVTCLVLLEWLHCLSHGKEPGHSHWLTMQSRMARDSLPQLFRTLPWCDLDSRDSLWWWCLQVSLPLGQDLQTQMAAVADIWNEFQIKRDHSEVTKNIIDQKCSLALVLHKNREGKLRFMPSTMKSGRSSKLSQSSQRKWSTL